MNIKAWSTALLILCLCPAAMAQKANRYLEKPLPQGWGKDVSHAIPGDDNLFSRQIPPIDDKWWKAFDAGFIDYGSLHSKLFRTFCHGPYGYG